MDEQLFLTLEVQSRLLSPDEIYALADGNWLKDICEDRRIERKSTGIQHKALAEYFSMWANTAPYGGVIAVGVANDGGIKGILSVGVNHINSLERAGDTCCPDAKYETRRVNVINDEGVADQILLIRVQYHEKKVVRTTEKAAFDRRGESKRTLSEDQIRELQIEKGEMSWEREPSSLLYPQDFDSISLRKFAKSVIESRRLEHVRDLCLS